MTLVIILFMMVSLGIVFYAYAMNLQKERGQNRHDMDAGRKIPGDHSRKFSR